MRLPGLSLRAAACVLATAAPLLIGLLRHPDLRFLPLIALAAAIAWAGLDRHAGAAWVAGLGCLWLLTLPGLLAAAGPAYYAFYYTLTAVLFLWLLPLAARHGALRAGFGALVLALGLIALACADYAWRTGIRPGQAAYFAIYQTHLEEGIGYVAEFVRPLTVGRVPRAAGRARGSCSPGRARRGSACQRRFQPWRWGSPACCCGRPAAPPTRCAWWRRSRPTGRCSRPIARSPPAGRPRGRTSWRGGPARSPSCTSS